MAIAEFNPGAEKLEWAMGMFIAQGTWRGNQKNAQKGLFANPAEAPPNRCSSPPSCMKNNIGRWTLTLSYQEG